MDPDGTKADSRSTLLGASSDGGTLIRPSSSLLIPRAQDIVTSPRNNVDAHPSEDTAEDHSEIVTFKDQVRRHRHEHEDANARQKRQIARQNLSGPGQERTWAGVQPRTTGTATQMDNEDAPPRLHEGATTEDSILNSSFREQFQNSVIRLPFVPAEETGQDLSVAPSIEPQVPIAVAALPPPSNHTLSALKENGVLTDVELHRWNHSYNAAGAIGGLPTKQFTKLRQQGFPPGLALEVGGSRSSFHVRFWSIDNSSGMDSDHCSSKQVKFHPGRGRTTIERCSRWNELQGSMEDQIRLACLMEFSSLFCLRNGVKGDRKFFVANQNSKSIDDDVQRAIKAIQQAPALGYTPLEKHVQEFTKRVLLLSSILKKQKQKAVCILAVGNLPADGKGFVSEQTKQQFLRNLTELGRLPVWIVIRLCTDDKNVADFYHDLLHTALPLVVIGESAFMHVPERVS